MGHRTNVLMKTRRRKMLASVSLIDLMVATKKK